MKYTIPYFWSIYAVGVRGAIQEARKCQLVDLLSNVHWINALKNWVATMNLVLFLSD